MNELTPQMLFIGFIATCIDNSHVIADTTWTPLDQTSQQQTWEDLKLRCYCEKSRKLVSVGKEALQEVTEVQNNPSAALRRMQRLCLQHSAATWGTL